MLTMHSVSWTLFPVVFTQLMENITRFQNMYLFTPEQVDISGDTLDHVKEQSDTMPTINREF